MAIRDRSRREAIARHRLKVMLRATPSNRRTTFRRRLGTSLGYSGSTKNRADQVTNIAKGRRSRLTDTRMRRINEWYRRRATGKIPGVDVPDVNARDYFVLNDNERIVLPSTWYKPAVLDQEFEQDPNIWVIAPPPNIIINTVAHIRAFAFGIIDRGGGAVFGASFTIPWQDLLIRASGDDIRDLFKKFNGVIYEAFLSPPPDGGYRILALAFTDAGARSMADAFDSEVDAYGYQIALESRRRPKGKIYKLRTVQL